MAHAVEVARVEEGDARLQGRVDRRERLPPVRLAVEGGHAHAAEAEGKDAGAGRPERPDGGEGGVPGGCAGGHGVLPVWWSLPYANHGMTADRFQYLSAPRMGRPGRAARGAGENRVTAPAPRRYFRCMSSFFQIYE
ncbi:hypothetical protein GCM10023329_12650 [Streptomyces sanyensis]|uniref:Uncharacterized protein n=1 Tax=Streptomyces sanyensis TaxID=568869 RepID=A0ABP8ZWW0_9ACTN